MYWRVPKFGRWSDRFRALDERSRVHLKVFGRQVGFTVACGLVALLLDTHRPLLGLTLMRAMFGFSALFVFCVAVITRQPVRFDAICIWDHIAGMVVLTLLCSVALQWLQPA